MRSDALVAAFPGAAITYDNAAYYDGLLHREVRANRCASCQRWHLPPQPVCPSCWSTDLVSTAVAGDGVVYMATELAGADGPRLLATVQLDEQEDLRLSLDLLDVDQTGPVIGRRVRLSWRPTATASVPVFVLAEGVRS